VIVVTDLKGAAIDPAADPVAALGPVIEGAIPGRAFALVAFRARDSRGQEGAWASIVSNMDEDIVPSALEEMSRTLRDTMRGGSAPRPPQSVPISAVLTVGEWAAIAIALHAYLDAAPPSLLRGSQIHREIYDATRKLGDQVVAAAERAGAS